ncbi:hypothetical protein Iz_59 [Brucella phage Iz]|nr:hypothetical protein Iz_59 [Brucella phage Iz]
MPFETTKSLPCANKTVNISAGVSHKKSRLYETVEDARSRLVVPTKKGKNARTWII